MDFNGVEIIEVIQMIECYYEVEIELMNFVIGNCFWVGKYDNLMIEDLFLSLQFLLDLMVEEKDGFYCLLGEGCK